MTGVVGVPGLGPISTVKLIGAGIVAIAIAVFIGFAFHWRNKMVELQGWQDNVVTVTSTAADLKDKKGRPLKLAPSAVAHQIELFGKALDEVDTKTAQAKADDLAHARTTETNQNRAGQETSNEYQAALARVRADYAERLRRVERQASGNQRGGGGTNLPGTASNPSGPNATASEERLPVPDALVATEQAIQLDAIQRFACRVGLAAPALCSPR